jgi:Kdo2-lipid IVA lauroyltransferase/acyltransferase
MYRLLARRRTIALDNIRQALPYMKRHPAWTGVFDTAEEIALATFINLGTSIVEVCRLYHGKGDELFTTMAVHGLDNFQRAKEKNLGMLCVSGHCGNWELISLSFKKHLDVSVWAIVRMQNNPYLNAIIEKMRMGYGNKVLYTKSALKPMLGVIKNNGVIGMLADQAAGEQNGILIDFLGRKAWALKAPVVIAHKTGVPVVPVLGYRENGEDGRHVLLFLPEYRLCGDRTEPGIARDVQALSRYLEEFVCAHPADWYWVHRRWKRAGEPTV